MHALLDHLNATILAGGALLLLGSMFLIQTDGAIDATERYTTVTRQAQFIEQLEFDLSNVGSGSSPGGSPIDTLAAGLLAFHGAVDTLGTTGLISYTLKQDSVRQGVQTYRVERRANGTLTGGSGGYVTHFSVTLLDQAGASLTDSLKHEAVAIEVAVEWLAPFERVSEQQNLRRLPRSAWSTTVRPLGLR